MRFVINIFLKACVMCIDVLSPRPEYWQVGWCKAEDSES